MQIFNFMLLWVATFTIVVSGFSIIDSQSRISRVKIPLAMGLFDNILGQGKGKAVPKKTSAPSKEALEAIAAYKKSNPNPKPGRGRDLSAEELTERFSNLASVTKGEEAALKVVAAVPEVLVIKPLLVKDNFAVFESKWGFEKTLGVITRNPNLLSVPTTGYGRSAGTRDETLYASYLIAATRPVGKPLLVLLLSLGQQLIGAARDGNNAEAKRLLKSGANANFKGVIGSAPLHWAAMNGQTSTCAVLLEMGANLEAKNNAGSTPLYCAARYGHNLTCSFLLDKGAKMETKNDVGATPLHWASMSGQTATCALLLERGANIAVKNNDGRRPVDVASNEETKTLLQNWKPPSKVLPIAPVPAKPAPVDTQPIAPLHSMKPPSTSTIPPPPVGKANAVAAPKPSPILPSPVAVQPPAPVLAQHALAKVAVPIAAPPEEPSSSSVPLKDISLRELSIILENLSFLSLVEPFRMNAVSGRSISRVTCYQEIMDIDKVHISKVVAETFYEDHVLEWKATGLVPKQLLLQQPSVTNPVVVNPPVPVVRMYVDPVTTILGHTYERANIAMWFDKHSTDPLTMEYVSSKFLTPNRAIKSAVEEFKKSIIATNLPSAASTSSTSKQQTDQDREKALAIWLEEMEQANQLKHFRLNHMEQEIQKLREGMAAIELRIVECIPEDIIEQLATLERSNRVSDRKKAEQLREKQLIEGSPPALQYYVTMQVSINGILTACTSISSDMVANQRRGLAASIATAIDTLTSVVSVIPFAKLGLDLLKLALTKWDERQQKVGVDRVMEIFLGDSAVISLVAEGVARGMALFRKTELEEAEARSRQNQRPKKTAQKVKEALRMAVAMCVNNNGEADHSKVRATTDAELILYAMMNGDLIVANKSVLTDTGTVRANTISSEILTFIRSKRF
eukprot:gene22852-31149_t